MPIYEYICEECGVKYDKFVRSGLDKVGLKCPRCGSNQAKKAFSTFGVRGEGSHVSRGASSSAAACGPVG